MDKVLLLGGAGFIGTNLAEYFVKQNVEIFVFDRKESNWENVKQFVPESNIIFGDFNDLDSLNDLLENHKIDIVVHLIASIIPETTIEKVVNELNQNLVNTIYLLEKMRQSGINKLVFFSSGGTVYGNNSQAVNSENSQTVPINSYGWTKLCIEKYIQMQSYRYGLQYLIVRPSNPYGRYQNIFGRQGLIAVTLGKVLNGQPIEIWGDGSVIRDYIFVEDLSRIVFELIQKNRWNEIYNIGSGIGTSINDVIDTIESVIGNKLIRKYKDARTIDFPVNILNNTKLYEQLGELDFISLKEGINRTWEWVTRNK
jgi:UDP-glucose 4-epimerase